jgi:TM2 domain-containing membrane protein YozV
MLRFRKAYLYKIKAGFTIILFNCALVCPKVCLLYDSLNYIIVDPRKIHH